MTLAPDPDTGELVGPASAVNAFLDGDEAPEATRHPAFRVWTEGDARPAQVRGDTDTCVLVTDRPGGKQAVLTLASEQISLALAAWLDLGPRPHPAEPAIRLAPAAMAVLIGCRRTHGHGLDPNVAAALQRRLDAGVRHWTVRVECPAWRRNLEVLEGDGGIWRLRPAGELVELCPTTTTHVVRELVALCEAGRAGSRLTSRTRSWICVLR
jgi:hypothetical protein